MRLSVQDVHQSFGTTQVLRGVDLEVDGGEIVALVGENGAGKSTLTRVLSGVYQPTSGTVAIDGAPQSFSRPQDAMAHGISVIYQEFRQNLFPHLSVAENLYVRERGAGHGRAYVRKRAMARDAERLLDRVGIKVDVSHPVHRLSVAEQQMVEIAKALSEELEMLILDEPTAALDDRESEQLFTQVRRMRDQGVGILYISHRLDEVFELADRIVVLRDGRVALSSPTAETTQEAVVAAMVGRSVENFYPKERHVRDGDPILRLRDLACRDAFHGVGLEVRPGEILGLGGVMGSGRSQVLEALFGVRPIDAGEVEVAGRPVRLTSPRRAMAAGIAYVSPDRGTSGVFPQRPTAENISIAALRDYVGPVGVVARGRERAAIAAAMGELNVRASSPALEIGRLSGGNQQKALFARWSLTRPRVLLLDEPTRGVDVGAKTEIYRILNRLAADGVGIILVSSDLPELVAMSDRVLVMRGGAIVAELTGESIDQQHILTHSLEVA